MNFQKLAALLMGLFILIALPVVGVAAPVELKAKNGATNIKTSSFNVTGNELRMKVWSPVNRTVGKVIDRVEFIGPNGERLSFDVKGSFQALNVARATVNMSAEQATTVDRLLRTRGTQVNVKMRIETFRYIVE